MLTAEGYTNYRGEPRVTVRDPWAVHIFHYNPREARELAAAIVAAADYAEEQAQALDFKIAAAESRKAEGM